MNENEKLRIDFLKVESRKPGETFNKVYFTCHKNDAHYYDEMAFDVFKYSGESCRIYRKKNDSFKIPDEEMGFIEDMSLVIVPVTSELLKVNEDNIALGEIDIAFKHNVTVLPFVMEPELDKLYESSVFGKTQWVSSKIIGKGTVPYEEKLKRFFDERFLKDETIQRIKKEFSSRIFFSYRKKDRGYVKPLMKDIHDRNELRDVAIWYDEYLPLAEDYSINIDHEIDKSNAVAFLVTDNLIEPGNYVKTVEYPKSKDKNKVILPIEPEKNEAIRRHVKDDFDKFIPGFPECVEIDELPGKFECEAKEDTPEHKYLMGLAYHNGIDVEKDSSRAVCLLTEAAESGDIAAASYLSIMYRAGNGVSPDCAESIKWGELYRNSMIEEFGESSYFAVLAEYNLGYTYCFFEEYKKAYKSCIKAYNLLRSSDGNGELLSNVLRSLSDICLKRGEHDKAAEFCEELNKYVGVKKLSEDSILAVRSNLAAAYYSCGQTDKAIKLVKELYEFCKNYYSGDDYRTLAALSNLATLYAKHERQEMKMTGLSMQKEAYSKLCKIFGDVHPAVLQSRLNLATVYGRIGNLKRSLKMKEEVYELCKNNYGERNYLTLNAMNNLAYTYGIMEMQDEALALKKRSYDLHNDVLGATHPNTLIACANFAYSLILSGDTEIAFELAKSFRYVCGQKLGRKHISSDTLERIYQNYKDKYEK
ncbi:MAG: tetratricopeptide repeat protein [Ruminococcaceae bacterium]|nr:tetratricopeptide repeat protein [Oscillospiraceae bacterium]